MREDVPSPNVFPLALDVVGACVAATALVPLHQVTSLVRSPSLKRAWRALTFLVLCGIVLLLLSVSAKMGRPLDSGDAFSGVLHVVGPSFALIVAWLSRQTARDMLRIEALEDAAFLDALTGLANRRRFDERLMAEVHRSRAIGLPLSLVVIDIDHFKRVNDTFGHGVGDLVLKQVAVLIEARSRHLDTACRVGGEEFVVIMPGLDGATAATSAERIRRAVAGTALALDGGEEVRATVSVGLATLRPGEGAAMLLSRADAALYDAKRDGRNRMEVAA